MARRTFVRTGTKRTSIWVGFGFSRAAVAGSTDVLLTVASAALLALRSFTIVRTRLTVLFESDQNAVTERPTGFLGAIVVKDQAVAIGITALPVPGTDADASWFLWQGMMNSHVFGSAVGFDGNAGSFYEIDTKSMRKVGINE